MARTAALTGPIEDFVLDAWAALSHKAAMAGNGSAAASQSRLVPQWVGAHRRRLTAYVMFQSYVDGVARNFAAAMDLADRNNYREYGDAKLLRDVLVDAVLGDRTEIVVDGAVNYDPDLDDAAQQAAERKDAAGAGNSSALPPPLLPQLGAVPVTNPSLAEPPPDEGPTPDELKANAEAKSAAEREEWLRDWAEDDDFWTSLKVAEETAVGLGGAVYALGWSPSENRVVVLGGDLNDLHDPGFFFPVRSDGLAARGYERVHLAWEVDRRDDGTVTQVEAGSPPAPGAKRYVHKVTYALVDLPAGGSRRYPWAEKDAPPSTQTCLMTDAYWLAPTAGNVGPDDFTGSAAFYGTNEEGVEVRDLDLGIDFIPVVHLRNTARGEWGESSLAPLIQLLDDLAFCDSDLASASATTGTPPIWTSGGGVRGNQVQTYGPGSWYTLPEGGQLNVLDTSNSLTALSAHRDALLHRLSVNSRAGDAALGRLAGQASSGVHLALQFSQLAGKVGAMRLVRKPIYCDLFAMVQKLAMAAGVLDAGVPHDAELSFGSYLPVDKPSVVAEVSGLLGAKAISRVTAIRLLVDAGFPVDDAQQEVERIEAGDFAGAVDLDTATGDRAAVYEYLHRDLPAAPPPGAMPRPLAPNLSGAQPVPTGGIGAQPAPGGQPPQPPPQAP